MKVYEILNARKIFENEVDSQFSVIYEEASCRNIIYIKNSLVESEETFKKKIYIFKDNGKSSLQLIKEYPVLDQFLLDEVKKMINDSYPEVFV